jgi:hypothetical protein
MMVLAAAVGGAALYALLKNRTRSQSMVPMVKGERDAAVVLALEAVADYALRLEAKIDEMGKQVSDAHKRNADLDRELYNRAETIRNLEANLKTIQEVQLTKKAASRRG